ncbi:Hypothetical predicted protein [Mytilus galloprovincialis]|uniref:Protein kinase domain-containing protein n=1 Tax=Mytilus galloprovincialis TaxID=29158 RepID=A0A8B6GRJ6_MYTGA|nr:Hypothetical predicted protein [Mytilus galloprovincialis]
MYVEVKWKSSFSLTLSISINDITHIFSFCNRLGWLETSTVYRTVFVRTLEAPTCHERAGIWIILFGPDNSTKSFKVHKEATTFELTGLSATTSYWFKMTTNYGNDTHYVSSSVPTKFAFVTTEEEVGLSSGGVGALVADEQNDENVLKMRAKINFYAIKVGHHKNILDFIGSVEDDIRGPMMILEYCPNGVLNEFLENSRSNISVELVERLFRMAFGICNGMDYLASNKVVHRRLAARNVLLNKLLEPKITGFGPDPEANKDEEGYIRHQKSSSINFFTDPEFLRARQVLDAIMKERATEGLGANARKQADMISVDEETSLYDKGILGVDNPQQLLDTLLYLCGLHFALRGGTEHRRLRLNSNPQITGPFQDKDAKLRYMLYKEDVSKANAGGLKHRKVVPKCVRAFENPENRNKCIVTVFEKYKSLCPANGVKDCFYLTPLKHIKDGQWYSNNPIGHNTLQGTVKRLCASIGLTGKRTNHSLRASAATRLYNAGIEEQRVAETTGHRSNAVRVYKRTSADQQSEASNILYGLRPSDGRKKAKTSAAAGAPVSSVSVECSTDESDKKTVTCNFSLNFSL